MGTFGRRSGDLAVLLWANRRRPPNHAALHVYWRETSDWLELELERWFGYRDFIMTPTPHDSLRRQRYRSVRHAYRDGTLYARVLDGTRFVRAHCAQLVQLRVRRVWEPPHPDSRTARAIAALWFTD
jgi:hypothetical protein